MSEMTDTLERVIDDMAIATGKSSVVLGWPLEVDSSRVEMWRQDLMNILGAMRA